MIEVRPQRKTVTYTYTSPKGVVVVVTDVPALVIEFESEPEEVMYEPEVSKKLNRIVREQLKLNAAPGVYHAHFDKYRLGNSVDMAVHISGPGVSYGNASTKDWKDALDRIFNSWNTVRKAYIKYFGVAYIHPPIVARAGTGSLRFDLQATQPLPLFLETTQTPTYEFDILRLFLDGYDLAINGESKNKLLQIPEIAIAALEGIERLSPNDSTLTEVELVPNMQTLHRKNIVSLTGSTYSMAKERRQAIQLSLVDKDSRQVMLVGQIYRFDRGGELTIKEIELNKPGVSLYNTTAKFEPDDDDLYEQLADLMKYKKRVLFKGIESRINGRWSNEPNIKTVEEAPSKEEVVKMRTVE